MKKFLFLFLCLLPSLSFSANSHNMYEKALKGLDIAETELNGNFLSVTFNRDKIGKVMLRSVVSSFCTEMYLDKKFAKKLNLTRIMITNKNYTHSFNFETDVKQYCNNIAKLNSDEAESKFPFDSYVSEN